MAADGVCTHLLVVLPPLLPSREGDGDLDVVARGVEGKSRVCLRVETMMIFLFRYYCTRFGLLKVLIHGGIIVYSEDLVLRGAQEMRS